MTNHNDRCASLLGQGCDCRSPFALDGCPFCEGGGVVPTASGMSDQDCLCVSITGTRRLIAEGRIEYAERCQGDRANLSEGREAQDQFLLELSWSKRTQAAHLINGCGYGPCTGNAGEGPCITVGAL
jgi:hypothetical protein